MRTRILLSAGIVLLLGGAIHAANSWTPVEGNLWSNPNNWAGGTLPDPDARTKIETSEAECTLDIEYAIGALQISDGGALMIVDGGVLTSNGWLHVGKDNQGSLTVINGGVLNLLGGAMIVGRNEGSEGHLTIGFGGRVNVGTSFEVTNKAGSSGFVHLEGGILDIDAPLIFDPFDDMPEEIDIAGGTMIVLNTEDNLAVLTAGLDTGVIRAYGGVGEVIIDPNTLPGKTILTGLHPLNPAPENGGIIAPGAVELSWVLPDPCVPGESVKVDVYFTEDYDTLKTFSDAQAIEAMKIVSRQNVNSVVVQTERKKRYYWAVDTDVNADGEITPNEYGPIFSFLADNEPPIVSAGLDVQTILVHGERTGPLNGTVQDDGVKEPYTVQWTVVSEPNEPDLPDAMIADPTAEKTTVTVYAEGIYEFQLEAFDGEYAGSDIVTITVNPDHWAIKEDASDTGN